MRYTLKSIINDHRGILSDFRDSWGRHICYCLERPFLSNEKNISAIPAGTYDCKVLYEGTEHFQYPVIEVVNVPNREGILFHGGNKIEDSKGCILPGNSMFIYSDYLQVGDSRDALSLLISLGDFSLKIPGKPEMRV